MKPTSNTSRNYRSELAGRRVRLLSIVAPTAALLIIGGLLLSVSPLRTYGKQLEAMDNNLAGGLVYLQSDSPGRPKVVGRQRDDLGKLSLDTDQSSTIGSPTIPAGCEALGMFASPRGPWLAVQVSCESGGFVQVVNAASGQIVDIDADLIRDSTFLSWSPTGNEIILRVDTISNPRVYRVHVSSGKADQLIVPTTAYDVALSPNGKRMIYSLTQGLGYGSETWIADIDGQNAEQVLVDSRNIIAFARWSPSGDAISYIRMPDSNVPFTIGELWVMSGDGKDPVLLGEADAGHGYRPDWSPDGRKIAFVVQEQGDEDTGPLDRGANYVADRLVSNIYLANLGDRSVSPVTQFSGALTETPVWSPDGEYIAFGTTEGGNGMDVWVFEVQSNKLNQVTHGAKSRYPAWLPVP